MPQSYMDKNCGYYNILNISLLAQLKIIIKLQNVLLKF